MAADMEPPLVWWRMIGVGIGLAIVLVGVAIFYVEAREAIEAGMNTVYPGQRRTGGGGRSIYLYASHFLDFWKTPQNTPAEWINIVEVDRIYVVWPAHSHIRAPTESLPGSGSLFCLAWRHGGSVGVDISADPGMGRMAVRIRLGAWRTDVAGNGPLEYDGSRGILESVLSTECVLANHDDDICAYFCRFPPRPFLPRSPLFTWPEGS